jgi:hypothetical protein
MWVALASSALTAAIAFDVLALLIREQQ